MMQPLPEQTMSADDAIHMAREKYVEMARAEERAGRELPAVEVPRSMGDVARYSVEASQELLRSSRKLTFGVSVSLRELEERAAKRRTSSAQE